MLPLGTRVQEKLERLLDEHMQSIGERHNLPHLDSACTKKADNFYHSVSGASKVSMSSITSEELWRKSGRLDKVSSEVRNLASTWWRS